jgi:hypothetical protein
MSTTTCPAADTARSAAATNDPPFGKSRSSEVCDKNTRHPPAAPAASNVPNPATLSTATTLKPASHPRPGRLVVTSGISVGVGEIKGLRYPTVDDGVDDLARPPAIDRGQIPGPNRF